MVGKVEIIPAVLSRSREEIHKVAQSVVPFAQSVQLDVVDGLFNSNLTWPYENAGVIAEGFDELALPSLAELFWEVHLMTQKPQALGEKFIAMGAKRIIGHIEALGNADIAREVFDAWHAAGAQVGISLLLDTPISAIEELIHDVEVVQVMSIAQIGVQGYTFDARAVVRITELRNRYPRIVIAVDGGVNAANAPELVAAGANRLCVGSAILKAEDPHAAYNEILRAIQTP